MAYKYKMAKPSNVLATTRKTVEYKFGNVPKHFLNKRVDRYTRAGHLGKDIICPLCCKDFTVYHFRWSAIVCDYCNKIVSKYEFFVKGE